MHRTSSHPSVLPPCRHAAINRAGGIGDEDLARMDPARRRCAIEEPDRLVDTHGHTRLVAEFRRGEGQGFERAGARSKRGRSRYVSAGNSSEFGVAATITCTSPPPGVPPCAIVIGSTVLARALLPINTNKHIVRVDGSDIDSATRGVGPCRAQLHPRRAVPTLGKHGLRIAGRPRRSSQKAGGNHRNEILRASLPYEPYEPLRTRLLNVNRPRYITPKTLGDGTTITTRIPSEAPPIQGNSPVDACRVTESE